LLVSFLLNLVVPKFIDELQYANWQSYVLYVGYVGVFHFGLLDGIVLRYSKYDYEELEKERICSQFRILLLTTTVLAIIGIITSALFLNDSDEYVFILVSVGIVIKNLSTYSLYTFQITNRINKYAMQIILQKVTYGVIVILLLIFRINDFYWYCLADLMGEMFGVIVLSFFNKGLYFGKTIGLSAGIQEFKLNISSGIILLFANWSSVLIIGSAKMIIQWHWDNLLFGKVSFAFSISNLFLVFVSAISVVLFPSLSRIDQDKLPDLYKTIRGILSPILFFAMIFYFPGCVLLKLWLPNYSESLVYLGVLLPIIIYTSKVSLLTNNYLKVYRKEKIMLWVNVISVIIGIILFLLCAYLFDNLYALLACVVLVVMFRSVLSEIFVLRIIHVVIIKEFIIEALMTVGFILCASLISLSIGCLVYTGLFLIYCAFNYKSIIVLFKNIFSRIKRKQ
jgi:O-antigen/teichoic acid export membrane protein